MNPQQQPRIIKRPGAAAAVLLFAFAAIAAGAALIEQMRAGAEQAEPSLTAALALAAAVLGVLVLIGMAWRGEIVVESRSGELREALARAESAEADRQRALDLLSETERRSMRALRSSLEAHWERECITCELWVSANYVALTGYDLET